jgi:aquaporin Z
MTHRVSAELFGTFILVFFGVGSAVFGIDQLGGIGPLGVAAVFGLVLLALAYAFGPISGCHVNPAVTLGVLCTGGISGIEAGAFMVAQLLGGMLGGGCLWLMVAFGGVTDQTGSLGTNGYGSTIGAGGALGIEVAMSAMLVLVVLCTTRPDGQPAFAGLAIGLTLAAMVAVGIPLTGASLNPARSLGPAVFHPAALAQIWVFLIAPMLGALVAVGIVRAVGPVPRPAVEPPASPLPGAREDVGPLPTGRHARPTEPPL